ncbi:MAG: hypothetical protein HY070_05855 [Chloroflexi bacterium]|nr:hypothetical protein [Chloroflexota bacterium]
MEALRIHTTLERDGEIFLTGLPFRKGEGVEMIVRGESTKPHLTARALRSSELIGLWKNRKEIRNSAAYARKLRESAQRRTRK